MLWEVRSEPFRMVAIEDGWMMRDPLEMFPGSDPLVWEGQELTQGRIRVSLGCFLISGPDGDVMVDTGLGDSPGLPEGAGSGWMPRALQILDVDPAKVVAVVHTHLHPDHVGGNLDPGGNPFFANARWYVHAAELAHWTGDDAGPAGAVVQRQLGPLLAAGRVEQLDGPGVVLPGVAVIETFGHTPGHVSVELQTDDETVVITGDVTHHPVQAEYPAWNVAADLDPEQAALTRRRLFDALTGAEFLLAAGHYPRPGFGRIGTVGRSRLFVPDPGVRHLRSREPADLKGPPVP